MLSFFIEMKQDPNKCWVLPMNFATYISDYMVTDRYFIPNIWIGRSSRPEVFCKKRVLRNLTKITGKHLCQSLFLRPYAYSFFKKQTLTHVFSCEFCQISKNTFFTEHLWTAASGFSYFSKNK